MDNRLGTLAKGGLTTTYLYDAGGQRVRKEHSAGMREFVYDQEGQLLGEYNAAGAVQEFVWLGGMPVAVLAGASGTTALHVYADHLGAPRVLSDASDAIRWRWISEPFGSIAPETAPTAGLSAVTFNLRFPGQFFDSESGLSYNYFRDYDGTTGRYVQSDPIGLNGGINTYSYVGGNPLSFVDSAGLAPDADCVARAAVIGAAGGAVIGGVAGGAAGGVGAGAACTLVAPGVGTIGCGAAGGAAGATAGGAKGAVIGGAAGAAVGSLMCSAAKPYVNDPQAQAEHDEYKRNYNSPPPPFNDPCEELRWRLKREEDLLKARQAWDAKWLPGRHAGMNGEIQSNNAIRKLREKMKQQVCDC